MPAKTRVCDVRPATRYLAAVVLQNALVEQTGVLFDPFHSTQHWADKSRNPPPTVDDEIFAISRQLDELEDRRLRRAGDEEARAEFLGTGTLAFHLDEELRLAGFSEGYLYNIRSIVVKTALDAARAALECAGLDDED